MMEKCLSNAQPYTWTRISTARLDLAEDAEDLAAFEERKEEPALAFEEVVRTLHRRAKL